MYTLNTTIFSFLSSLILKKIVSTPNANKDKKRIPKQKGTKESSSSEGNIPNENGIYYLPVHLM
jgi:hypothetical protein